MASAILQRNLLRLALTPRRRRRRWNSHPSLSQLQTMLRAACTATTVAEALVETKYPERPVWVLHAEAHAGLASHSALAAANVDATAADPPGESIGRFAGTT